MALRMFYLMESLATDLTAGKPGHEYGFEQLRSPSADVHEGEEHRKDRTPKKRASRPATVKPRPRHKWEAERFLAALREHRSVRHACLAVGIAVSTAYHRRQVDPSFAEAWDSVDFSMDVELRDSIRKRAIDGTRKAIVKAVATWEEPDPTKGGAIVRHTRYAAVGYETVFETGLTIWFAETKLPLEFMRQVVHERARVRNSEAEPAGSIDEFL